MSTDDSNQGNNNIILYIVRCTGEKSEDSLTEQTEIVFRANQEINNINNYFLYLKKIKGPPNHEDILDFYNHTFFKFDAEFEGITSDKTFIDMIQQCECFADFVRIQPISFKEKLLQYLFRQDDT